MATARILLIAIATLAHGPLMAGEAAPQAQAPAEHRLSPEEIEKVLADAARKREGRGGGTAPGVDEDNPSRPTVHGQVGFSIGTGGYRSAYGTAFVDLPGNSHAVISMGTERLGNEPYYYPGW